MEKPQQKQIDLVQTLFCVGMTLKSGQDAAKMREDGPDDGPDEPSGPFLNAKMACSNWLKKQQEKSKHRTTIGSRSDHRNSEVDLHLDDAVASLPTPYPFSSNQPRGDSSHL